MKNMLTPDDIGEWKFVSSFAFTTHHHTKFVNELFGLEMEKITNISAQGNFGKPKTYFYITGQEKEYTDLEQLCVDWNEIKNFDDPNNEIQWVKKIVPVIKLNTV